MFNIKNIKCYSKTIIMVLTIVITVSSTGYWFYLKKQKEKIENYISEVKIYEEDFSRIIDTFIKNESKCLDILGDYSEEQLKFVLTYMTGNISVAVGDKYKIILENQSSTRVRQIKYLEELTPPDKFKDNHANLVKITKNISSNWDILSSHVGMSDSKLIENDLKKINDETIELSNIFQQIILDIESETYRN